MDNNEQVFSIPELIKKLDDRITRLERLMDKALGIREPEPSPIDIINERQLAEGIKVRIVNDKSPYFSKTGLLKSMNSPRFQCEVENIGFFKPQDLEPAERQDDGSDIEDASTLKLPTQPAPVNKPQEQVAKTSPEEIHDGDSWRVPPSFNPPEPPTFIKGDWIYYNGPSFPEGICFKVEQTKIDGIDNLVFGAFGNYVRADSCRKATQAEIAEARGLEVGMPVKYKGAAGMIEGTLSYIPPHGVASRGMMKVKQDFDNGQQGPGGLHDPFMEIPVDIGRVGKIEYPPI